VTVKSIKKRNKRFNGHGNVRIDGRPSWQLTCKCGATTIITNTHLSPDALVKKFKQRGWDVGAHVDVCPECQYKTVSSHTPVAKKAIADMLAPMAKDEQGNAHHVNELKAEIASLPPEQLREIVKFTRGHIPVPPKREKKVKPVAPEDPDYHKWLDE